jgi:hypothetical protein
MDFIFHSKPPVKLAETTVTTNILSEINTIMAGFSVILQRALLSGA